MSLWASFFSFLIFFTDLLWHWHDSLAKTINYAHAYDKKYNDRVVLCAIFPMSITMRDVYFITLWRKNKSIIVRSYDSFDVSTRDLSLIIKKRNRWVHPGTTQYDAIIKAKLMINWYAIRNYIIQLPAVQVSHVKIFRNTDIVRWSIYHSISSYLNHSII